MHVAITGASGFLGAALQPFLRERGWRVTPLVRRRPKAGEIGWDPEAGRLDPADLEGVDAVVHLAGESIGARWTAARKQRIRESRVRGTTLLSDAIAAMAKPPSVLVSMSAVGIYGDRGDELLTDISPVGPPDDFLVRVGTAWEGATASAKAAGIRVAHPRLGLVIGPGGGVLAKMLLPFRLGLGGRLGSGRQWTSWIALDDAVAVIHHALTNAEIAGPLNATAPAPVTNREFTAALARAVSRPAVVPVPAFALRLLFGEMADAALLASARAVPSRLVAAGFRFRYPALDEALRRALG